jgi:hypothetical protein
MLKIEKSYDRYTDFMVAHRNGEFLTTDDAIKFMEQAMFYFGHDRFNVVRKHDVKITPRKGWFNQLFGLKDRAIGCVRLEAKHLTAWGEEHIGEKYADERI